MSEWTVAIAAVTLMAGFLAGYGGFIWLSVRRSRR